MAVTTQFATIEEAIEEIREGRMVVVVDDEDRENEGDLTVAAQFATPDAINFMATHARGLVCPCLTEERADELGRRPGRVPAAAREARRARRVGQAADRVRRVHRGRVPRDAEREDSPRAGQG